MSRNLENSHNITPAPTYETLSKNGYHDSKRTPEPPLVPIPRIRWGRVLALPLTFALVCGLTAFVITNFFMTRWYQSDTTLLFSSTANSSGTASLLQQMTDSPNGDAGVALDGGLYTTPLVGSSPNMAMSVMATNRCQAKVVQALHLDRRWHVSYGAAMGRLKKRVSYGMDRNNFLAISAQDPDPKLALQIVNAYVAAVREVSTDLSINLARLNRKALENRLASLKAVSIKKGNELVALQVRASRTMPLGTASTTAYQTMEAQRQQAEIDLQATNAQIQERLRTAKIASAHGTDLPAQVPYAQQANQRLRDLESQFAAVHAEYGSEYPQYQTLAAQVKEARAEAEAEVKREAFAVQKGLTPDVAQLYATQKSLQAKLAGIKQASAGLSVNLLSLPALQMRQAELQSQVDVNNVLIRSMSLEVEKAQEVEDRNVPAFQVVDYATLPHQPVLPRVWFSTIGAVVAGFLLGLAYKTAISIAHNPVVAGELHRLTEKYNLIDQELPLEPLDTTSEVHRVLEADSEPSTEVRVLPETERR